MFKNYSYSKTQTTSNSWKNLSEQRRRELIENEIKKDVQLIDFAVHKTTKDGQIIFRVNKTIPSNKRGLLLIDLEEKLKKNIDKGLTVWFEPVGDKSVLRNLRGIKIK